MKTVYSLNDKDYFECGSGEEFFPSVFVDNVIEDLKQQAFQEIDDENFLSDIEEDEKEELSKKLNDCLKTFIKKHCLQSTRFYVRNIKKYFVSYDKKIIRELEYKDKN